MLRNELHAADVLVDLPQISRTPPLNLPHTSPKSPPYLPHTSPIFPAYLPISPLCQGQHKIKTAEELVAWLGAHNEALAARDDAAWAATSGR